MARPCAWSVSGGAFVGLDGPAELLLLLPELACGVNRSEVLGLVYRANLTLDIFAEGRALDQFNRLIQRLHLPDPVARDEVLRLLKRSVNDGPLAPVARQPFSLG